MLVLIKVFTEQLFESPKRALQIPSFVLGSPEMASPQKKISESPITKVTEFPHQLEQNDKSRIESLPSANPNHKVRNINVVLWLVNGTGLGELTTRNKKEEKKLRLPCAVREEIPRFEPLDELDYSPSLSPSSAMQP